MKRQFIQMQPGPTSSEQTEPGQMPGQTSIEPKLHNATVPGKGLLSKWKAGTIDQDTLIQRAAQSPATGPLFNRPQAVADHAQAVERVFDPAGPISPHQSAIGLNLFVRQAPSESSSLLDPGGPIAPHQSQAGIDLFATHMGAMPAQRGPASQANVSFAAAPPPTIEPRGPQTLPGFAPWPQGAPGQPGYRSGTPPQTPPAPTRRKKRRVLMWARIAIVALLLLVLIPGGIGIYYYLSISPHVE